MVVTGIAFVLFWALVKVFTIELTLAAIVTGVVFILLGLLLEGVPSFRRP